MPSLPRARGPLSALVLETLAQAPGSAPSREAEVEVDPLSDDDFALALYVLYELSYRSFDEVDERWEWEPSLIALRADFEAAFERALLDDCASVGEVRGADVPERLRALAAADDGPSLSRFLETRAERWQMLEFLEHRSAYHLKEADPHTWAVPRLAGRSKAALVEIQADEYGGGDPERMHAHLFARTLSAAGLSATYGAYLDELPGVTLATVNLMSMLGLHRRWRGAIVGHLALFEMTSTLPNRRYGNGLRRLGFPVPAAEFFDEHVEADAVHENIAAHDLAGSLADAEGLGADIVAGATMLHQADQRFAAHLLGCWERGESSLLGGATEPASAELLPA
jgi:hypothetical protein